MEPLSKAGWGADDHAEHSYYFMECKQCAHPSLAHNNEDIHQVSSQEQKAPRGKLQLGALGWEQAVLLSL